MEKNSRIFVAGHLGLVGSAIVRKLRAIGHEQLVLRPRQELDLRNQAAVHEFFRTEKIDYVFMAAARVGGIHANAKQQAEFLYDNIILASNVIHASAQHGVRKLLFLGSSCIYPRLAPQPMREESLLSGPLEPTNEGYALAKIAGLKLCEYLYRQKGHRFISAMPTNLYGPGDNFHATDSHVIPGLMRRLHEAKVSGAPEVAVWGTGKPRREFLHADDVADALCLLMDRYEDTRFVNVGSGIDCTIAELAEIMRDAVGFEGRIAFDASRPDGAPRKLLDVSRMFALGWRPRIGLQEGLRSTYEWGLANGVLH